MVPKQLRASLFILIAVTLLALTGCTMFNTSADKDENLRKTEVALAIQRTSLALTAEGGSQAMIAAQQATIDAANAAGGGAPTPDLVATQVAISVQQTLAAGGSSVIPAEGTPTTQALPGIAPSDTPPTFQALPGIAPSETPPAYLANPGFSNFTDNFLDPTSGWPVQNSGTNQWWYANDHYYISVGSAETQVVVTPGYTLADGYVIASGTITQDQPQAYYGVVCRFQDFNNYYFFEIGLDGYYRIGKMWNGQWSLIGMGQPKYSLNAYKSLGQYNQITGHCHSNELTLHVNDILVETVYDNTFASGQIGLSTSTGGFPGMTAAFDYIIAEE